MTAPITAVRRVLDAVLGAPHWTIRSVHIDDWHSSVGEKLRTNHDVNVRVVARYGQHVMLAIVPMDVEPRYRTSRSRQ